MDKPCRDTSGCRYTKGKCDIADLCDRTEGKQFFDVVFIDGQNGANKNSAKRKRYQNELQRKPCHIRHACKDIKDDPRHDIKRRLCCDGGKQ